MTSDETVVGPDPTSVTVTSAADPTPGPTPAARGPGHDTPRRGSGGGPGGGSGVDAELLERGAALGRYLILDRLGAGGMGVVYAAYDPQLDRKVAIKLVRTPRGPVSSEGPTRLLREAQAMAKLAHPNVVAVHDVGIVDAQVFIAMEFVEGQTLGAWMKAARADGGQPRPWAEVLDVFVAAGEGLRAAHEVGLVHRDFKPDNVLIGADGRVRVMDFGLARTDDERRATGSRAALPSEPIAPELVARLSEGDDASGRSLGTTSPTLTVTGTIMGTPAYMAPEQHLGLRADARADQFSFCVALYEALYGRRPFAGDNRHALAIAVLEGRPAAPPKTTEVPAWLHGVVVRGLTTDADGRFASMAALLDAIAEGREPPRSRASWAVAAALGLGLAAALGAWFADADDPTPAGPCDATFHELDQAWGSERRDAVADAFTRAGLGAEARATALADLDGYAAAWTRMRKDSCEATRVRASQSDELLDLRSQCLDRRRAELGALVDLLADGNPAALAKANRSVEALPPIEICADVEQLRARVPMPEDPGTRAAVDRGEAIVADARAHFEAGLYADAAALLDEVEAAALAHAPLAAAVAELRGRVQISRGEYVAAERSLAAAALDAARGRDDRLLVEIQIDRFNLFGDHLGEPDKATDADHLTEVALARIGGEPALDRRRRLIGVSVTRVAGKPDEALAQLDALLTELREAGETETDFMTQAELMRAALLANLGRFEDGTALLNRKIAALEQRLGADHPILVTPLINLAALYIQHGEVEPSRAAHERVVALAERRLGPKHPDTARAYEAMGLFHYYLGEFARSRENLERAVDGYAANFDAGHPSLVRARGNLAAILIELGEHAEAERVLIDCRDALVARFGRDHDYLAFLLINLAELYTDLDRHDEARASIRWARANAEANFGRDNHRTAEALVIEGRVEHRAGDPVAAVASLEAALDIYGRIEIAQSTLALAEGQLGAALVELPGRRAEGERQFATALARARAAGESGAGVVKDLEELAGEAKLATE